MFRAALDLIKASYGVDNINYLPLLNDCQEIRLLELYGHNTAHIRYVPIDAAPSFLALSYTWGDPRPVTPFYLEGKKILLPKTLAQALSRVFKTSQKSYPVIFEGWPVVIWADAICINQKDDVEKARQVAMMGSIYRRASRIIVYLGEDKADSEVTEPIYSLKWAYVNRSSNRSQGFQNVPDLRTNKGLSSFLRRPWWNRIWTLQEIIFAGCATFLCGDASIDWSAILDASFLLRDINNIAAVKGYGPAIAAAEIFKGGISVKSMLARRGYRSEGARKPSWFVMLAVTTQFESTDLRDRLYALVGLSQELPGFDISYTRPADEVFQDFTTRYLGTCGNLELLQLCGVIIPDGRALPSWVPNYENLNHAMLDYGNRLQSMHYADHIKNEFKVWDVCNGLPSKLHPSTDPTIIRPEGVEIDTIYSVNKLNRNWLQFVYDYFSTEYNPPTMKCHILQAYFRTILGDRNESTNSQLSKCIERYKLAGTFWNITRKKRNDLIQEMNISGPIEDILLDNGERWKNFTVQSGSDHAQMSMIMNQKGQCLHLFVTPQGYMGYGPQCQTGDVICALFGCSVPLILRRTEQGRWTIIGQCFVLGIMNGELCQDLFDRDDVSAGNKANNNENPPQAESNEEAMQSETAGAVEDDLYTAELPQGEQQEPEEREDDDPLRRRRIIFDIS